MNQTIFTKKNIKSRQKNRINPCNPTNRPSSVNFNTNLTNTPLVSYMISIIKDNLHEYKAIKRQNQAFKIISKYIISKENTFQLKDSENNNIVWQFWETPTNPPRTGTCLVSSCMKSINQYIWDGFEQKILNLEDSKHYVLFPDFVYEKLESKATGFTITAFSDILRLALLIQYGGIWVDATILALRPLKDTYLLNRQETGFSFERSFDETSKTRREWRHYDSGYFSWSSFSRVRWLNSFIVSGKNKETLIELLRILLLLWKHENNYPHYFSTQIIYNHLIKKKGFPRFASQSDVPVHFLQKYANETYDKRVFDTIKKKHPIQKMNWKIEASKIRAGNTFFNNLFLNTKIQTDPFER